MISNRLSQVRPAPRKELLKIFALIVGIGPAAAVPLLGTVMQGDLGIDAVLQIDTVVSIFRRHQHQLGFGDVTRVDIDGATFGVIALSSVGKLQIV